MNLSTEMERCTFKQLPDFFQFVYNPHQNALYKTYYGVVEEAGAPQFIIVALVRNPRAPAHVPHTPPDVSHIKLNLLESREVCELLKRRGLTPFRAPHDNEEHYRLIELMCGPK